MPTQTMTYSVPGVSCEHCRMAITEEVSAVAGVESVDVDLTGSSCPFAASRRRRCCGSRCDRRSRLRRGRLSLIRLRRESAILRLALSPPCWPRSAASPRSPVLRPAASRTRAAGVAPIRIDGAWKR